MKMLEVRGQTTRAGTIFTTNACRRAALKAYHHLDHQPTSGFFMALTGSEAYALHQFHNSYEPFVACLCTSV